MTETQKDKCYVCSFLWTQVFNVWVWALVWAMKTERDHKRKKECGESGGQAEYVWHKIREAAGGENDQRKQIKKENAIVQPNTCMLD